MLKTELNPTRPVLGLMFCMVSVLLSTMIMTIWQRHRIVPLVQSAISTSSTLDDSIDPEMCRSTCRLIVVESIPENVTFPLGPPLPESTFNAWHELILGAKKEIQIAAYKSSLRGKHVFGKNLELPFSIQGEQIFEALLDAGKRVPIRILENHPPKDHGDNEDGIGLAKRGAVTRRCLDFAKMFGGGTMHSKFLIADRSNLYVGSANLDWRSLNQKMELGVFIRDCPCVASDLLKVFESYWLLSQTHTQTNDKANTSPALYNLDHPLTINYRGLDADIYIATSPRWLNSPNRTWDLDAILDAIRTADKFIYIHVMDYMPMFVYQTPQQYWPILDDALRIAAVSRGLELRLLVGALHFVPQTMVFLRSLQALNGNVNKASIKIRIFKVPTSGMLQSVMLRERRTHNKFMVTDKAVIIGTSNWSGDYFDGDSTGAAVVVRRAPNLVTEMRDIFRRDWQSDYAHRLQDYFEQCVKRKSAQFCEVDKDPALLSR